MEEQLSFFCDVVRFDDTNLITRDEIASRGAIFSECKNYRYKLWRTWDISKGKCVFICLNPSTATEIIDDPTVRRCINYAKVWGYGELIMMNIFAYRATDPKIMKEQSDPVGPENDEWLLKAQEESDIMIAAWGTHGSFMDRENQVKKLLSKKLHYLELTKHGHPKHPLYLKKTLTPIPYINITK